MHAALIKRYVHRAYTEREHAHGRRHCKRYQSRAKDSQSAVNKIGKCHFYPTVSRLTTTAPEVSPGVINLMDVPTSIETPFTV